MGDGGLIISKQKAVGVMPHTAGYHNSKLYFCADKAIQASCIFVATKDNLPDIGGTVATP